MANDDLLRQVADELEIRNVIARLAQLADSGDLDEYGSLYTEDAHWELLSSPGDPSMMAPRRGRADIIAGGRERRASGGQGPGSHTRHVLSTSAVRVSGDTAVATSYLTFYKNTDTQPEIMIMTSYADQLKRTREGWKVASRIMTKA